MRAGRLQSAFQRLIDAIRDVEKEVAALQVNHDPLASHIFVSRREFQAANDTKSGKRSELRTRLSYSAACELGFRGSFNEWERLLGAAVRR